MTFRAWFLSFWAAVLLPGLLLADQVTLKNGDRITGQIGKKDAGKLTIKSELLGDVEIPWAAITALMSEQDLLVVTTGGKSAMGKLTTSDGKVEIAAPAAKEVVPLADISVIRNAGEQKKYQRLEHPGVLALWAGYFDLGLALARGNARTSTFTTAFSATRATRTDKTKLYFNQIDSTATIGGSTATTAQAIRGGWAYDRNFSSRLFVDIFNDFEHDRFQNLDLRLVIGGGLGFTPVKTERSRFDVLGGMDYNRSKFSTPLTRNSMEADFGEDWTYKLSGITSLSESLRIFPNLTNGGEYRMNFDFGAITTLKKWLSWQVTASDRLLSNPVPGRKRNDVLLTTGFRVSFAR